MRLRSKYSITITILISVVITLMSALLFYQFNNNAKGQQALSTEAISDAILRQMLKRGEFISSYFATHLADAIYYEDQDKISQALQSSLTQQDLLFANIIDPQGNIINDGSIELWSYGKKVDDQAMLDALNQSNDLYYRIEADKIIFARNITVAGERIASVHIGFSLLYIQDDIAKTKITLQNELSMMRKAHFQENISIVLIASLLLLGVGVSIAIFISNKLTAPIHILADYARAIGNGEHLNKIKLQRSDELGELANIFNTMNKRLLKNKQEMHYQAFHDRLTGLPNRHMFHKYLNKSLLTAASNDRQVAVLFLDLDGFKMVNDTYGHESGDQLLMVIAERFNTVIRKQDVISIPGQPNNMLVSRIGGDEFTIVLQGIGNKDIAAQIASRITESVASPILLNGQKINIGVSVGISIYPQDGDNADTLLKHADLAMYQAKKLGKGRYAFY